MFEYEESQYLDALVIIGYCHYICTLHLEEDVIFIYLLLKHCVVFAYLELVQNRRPSGRQRNIQSQPSQPSLSNTASGTFAPALTTDSTSALSRHAVSNTSNKVATLNNMFPSLKPLHSDPKLAPIFWGRLRRWTHAVPQQMGDQLNLK